MVRYSAVQLVRHYGPFLSILFTRGNVICNTDNLFYYYSKHFNSALLYSALLYCSVLSDNPLYNINLFVTATFLRPFPSSS
jgi:hypothetical protein